jgi:hypothetical protein
MEHEKAYTVDYFRHFVPPTGRRRCWRGYFVRIFSGLPRGTWVPLNGPAPSMGAHVSVGDLENRGGLGIYRETAVCDTFFN